MPGIEIKGQSKRANYRHGGGAKFSMGRAVKEAGKAMKLVKEFVEKDLSRKAAKKTQDAKDKIQKSEMGYKKGGKV